jgi:hypothetical protein
LVQRRSGMWQMAFEQCYSEGSTEGMTGSVRDHLHHFLEVET